MSEHGIYLEVTQGDNKGTCYRMVNEVAVIGRSAECDIRLENVRGVSRNHCRVYVTDQGLRLQDLESQNGTIVQGKRIRDAIVAPGISFRIGEVEFTVRNASALPVAAGATDLAVAPGAAGGALGAPAGFDGGGLERVSGAMELAGAKSRNVLLQLLVLVSLVVGGLYAMQMFTMKTPGSPVFAVVRSYERKAVNFRCDFDQYEIKSKSDSGNSVIQIQEYNGLLRRSLIKLSENKNALKRRVMIVVGQVNGDAWVKLSKNGHPLGTFLIVCRGIDPYHIPEAIEEQEAKGLAARAFNQAKALEADGNEYYAWKNYEMASKYYNYYTDNVNADSEARVEAQRLQFKLENKLTRIFDEAMLAAFPAEKAVRKSNYSEALLLLDQAKMVLPDEDNPDRQVIDSWYDEIRRLESRGRRK